jgi:hypothetical protein
VASQILHAIVSWELTPTGSEPYAITTITDNGLQQTTFSSAAQCGADGTIPEDLRQIIDAWPNVPEAIRRAILTLIGTVQGTRGNLFERP